MKRTFVFLLKLSLVMAFIGAFNTDAKPSKVDALLAKGNAKAKQPLKRAGQIDGLTFLRRASIDIIGRIPTHAEIEQFQKWPEAEDQELPQCLY